MSEEFENKLDFTENAREALYSAVDSEGFIDNDAEMIYDVISKRLKFIPFGEYLKRYIYRSAGIEGPFEEVGLDIYRRIIRDSFADTDTPPSFEPTSAKLSALSKNWLTQQSVSRKVVFLLGFGLGMPENDVDRFLTKALRERGFNAKDPFEIICWHCFRKGYGYPKFNELWNSFLKASPQGSAGRHLLDELTVAVRGKVDTLSEDDALIAFASQFKTKDNRPKLSVSTRKCFDGLFAEAKRIVAEIYTRGEEERARIEAAKVEDRLLRDDRVSDSERNERIRRIRAEARIYKPEDITESDLEHIISSAIPVDRHGNLTPSKASALSGRFDGKRFSRQHINDILEGNTEATRFDIITLNFFIMSQSLDQHPNKRERYFSFINSTNRLLEGCGLGELYISNPYECFVLMCLLSEDPLGTYADVWELSYEN